MASATRTRIVLPDATWEDVYNSWRESIVAATDKTAKKYVIDVSTLRHRLLLHLPRFSPETLDQSAIETETERLAAGIDRQQSCYTEWITRQPFQTLDKHSASVREVPSELARVIHERFHYIGYFRDGTHFGAYYNEDTLPFVMATVSTTDLKLLRAELPRKEFEQTRLVSRVYAFHWAPRNSISYLLGFIRRIFSEARGVSRLFTWVNPNLGFLTASYRASNWHLHTR
jgi:hypothetical protein